MEDDQDFPDLQPPIRLDDDALTALERRATNRRGRKPADVTHDPITNQTGLVAQRLAPRSLASPRRDSNRRVPPTDHSPYQIRIGGPPRRPSPPGHGGPRHARHRRPHERLIVVRALTSTPARRPLPPRADRYPCAPTDGQIRCQPLDHSRRVVQRNAMHAYQR